MELGCQAPSLAAPVIHASCAVAAILRRVSPRRSEPWRKPGPPGDKARREASETMPFQPYIWRRVGRFRRRHDQASFCRADTPPPCPSTAFLQEHFEGREVIGHVDYPWLLAVR